MADNVRIISDDSLRRVGFSDADIQAAASRSDAYVGESNGVKYYRAQNELNMAEGEFKSTGEMPDQMGEGNNRFGRPRFGNE